MLLFSAKQGKDHRKIVAECLLPWLQLLHAKTPGVSVILVCSHAQSPPEGWTVEDVRNLADAVHKEVLSPPSFAVSALRGFCPFKSLCACFVPFLERFMKCFSHTLARVVNYLFLPAPCMQLTLILCVRRCLWFQI